MVYIFIIKCENTSVGEDFKELCVFVNVCFSGITSTEVSLKPTETNCNLQAQVTLAALWLSPLELMAPTQSTDFRTL